MSWPRRSRWSRSWAAGRSPSPATSPARAPRLGSPAKSGLLGLARTLAVEWAPHGIRVNVLAPGFFATEMTRDVADDPGRRAVYARIPMGRTGEPDDLGGAVVFLAAPASAYVTGQVLAVDGGWTVA